MFRRATVRLIPHRRAFSTPGVTNEVADVDLFTAAWRKIVPNLEPPKTPLTFFQPRPSTASAESIPPKLTVNLVSPYSSQFSNKQVDMVIVPATTGQMGILPGHVSSISELKPGLISIHEGNEVTSYFISSGFAFVHSMSVTDIIAVEAVPIEQVDRVSVQKGIVEFTRKMDTVTTDMEKAKAQIGLDVLNALSSSLSGQSN